MTTSSAFRALTLAAGLALALPGLASARDLTENVNNGTPTGNPFAYPMAVTHASEHGLPANVGRSASATGNPAEAQVDTVVQHAASQGVPGPVGNSASAVGGPGTGAQG